MPSTSQLPPPADLAAHAPIHLPIAPLYDDPNAEPRIVEHWRTVRRSWRAIAACAAVAVLATGLYVVLKTPLYTAESKILIERRTPQILDVREIVADGIGGEESNYYRTQQEILQSRALAVEVIRELGLDRDPAFTGASEDGGLIAGAIARVRASLAGLLRRAPAHALPDDGTGVAPEVVDRYLGSLSVAPITRTRLAVVRFTSPDPVLSAKVANAHVQAYIAQGLRLRSEATDDARRFMEAKLVELKERLEASEVALNAYRRSRGILSLDEKENIVVERLSDLNRRLSEAEGRRIALEAEIKLIQSRDYDSLPGVANNPLIQAIKGQLAEVERQYVELSAQFKPTYPAVEQAQAQVRDMRERLRKEIAKVVSSIESAYMAAADTEGELARKMEEQKAETLRLKDASVQYAILQREADANRGLYDSVLQRMKEIGVAAAVQASNVSVVDVASVPRFPSSPQKKRALLLALLAGVLGGVGLVLGRSHLDNSLKGAEDVERFLHVPSLGLIPGFDELRSDAKAASQLAFQAPRIGAEAGLIVARDSFSVVTEAYRSFRTALLFSQPEVEPRTLLFTSALAGEGKTTTSLNTGIAFGQLGARVLIIDADLRRATAHRRFGLANREGLSEVLTGRAELDTVTRPTSVDGVWFVSAGQLPPNPTELLASRSMAKVITQASERFDYVIIDSPPVMAVNDAVVLSPMVDGVVMVVEAHETPRKIVQRAEQRLCQARARILGVLLNRVDATSDHYSTYYGGNYYSSYYHGTGEARV
ncbi:MAG: polysaccharide biosynthesis tyrosine autokinase [Thermodesulfobacteriota bacterium]